MKAKDEKDLSGIWAVAWRSFVFLPIGLAAFFLLVGCIAALLLPPFIGAVFLFYGLWWQAILIFIVWSFVIWAWRHFRISRFFESPPSLL